ncbi:cation:proton antiporter [Streptococcus dysgalactiae]|uniref:cation:proton antiporter n=1 Tax=Streptococcus dysgalactiae TaxID=1334 RepID=UPI000F71F4CF|nr:sodium:proton antiporter [Streptococcus dysgalactiae]MEE3743329.1 sodium:proton antiporter [Streptococcus dysgalactiae]VDZ41365.1 membrane protein [Streptococcus dysgalactiae subsp. dysgalactiae]
MPLSMLLILFLMSLILSNVLNRIFPQLPLPAIQLLFGLGYGIWHKGTSIPLDPELFLAFVIAPLNFREGQESDIKNILTFRSITLYLILPTVLLTTVFLGLTTYHLLPIQVPLAVAFAMGAALAPTDAVALLSIAKRFNFPQHIKHILTSEGLLNDASGLVAFQFALTALTTGYFSLTKAGLHLFLAIVGGFLTGLGFALIHRLLLSILEKFDAKDVTGALLLELTLPIVSYFIAHLLGFSAIISVVTAGLMQTNRLKKVTLFDAQADRVTHIIWGTIKVMLNGFVFLVFGIELAEILGPVLSNPHYSNSYLFGLVIALTVALFLIRFGLISLFYLYHSIRHQKSFKDFLVDIVLLTFSGAKGSVSIATILLLPRMESFQHSLVLFIVGAVTLVSFSTGLIVLPRLLPPLAEPPNHFDEIKILTTVLQRLEIESKQAPDNQAALYQVMDIYNQRIEHLILEQEPNSVKEDLAELQLLIIGIETKGLEHAFSTKAITIKDYRLYQAYLKSLERQINRSFISSFRYGLVIFLRIIRRWMRELLSFRHFSPKLLTENSSQDQLLDDQTRNRLTDLYLGNSELILEALEDLEGYYNVSLVDFLQGKRIQDAELIKSGLFVERVITHFIPDNSGELLHAFYLERRAIYEAEQAQEITPTQAHDLRHAVNELETYSLRQHANPLMIDVVDG